MARTTDSSVGVVNKHGIMDNSWQCCYSEGDYRSSNGGWRKGYMISLGIYIDQRQQADHKRTGLS